MKFFLAVLLGAMLSATSLPSYAYDEARARNNFAHEAAECAAYFLFISFAPGLDPKTSQALNAKARDPLAMSVALTSEELTTARVLLATETMKREMKQNWSNISIVYQKYGYPCLDFTKDPVARMTYWLEKQD